MFRIIIVDIEKEILKTKKEQKDREDERRTKIVEYLKTHGYPNPDVDQIDWFLDYKKPEQVDYMIDNDLSLLDFDEWNHLQRVIFGGNDTQSLDYETCQKIGSLLWEKDIEVLEIPIGGLNG